MKTRTHGLGDTLDVVTKDLAVTLGAAPGGSPTTSVASQHHRVAGAPRYRSHRRDMAAIPQQRGIHALSETLSTLSTSRHDELEIVERLREEARYSMA